MMDSMQAFRRQRGYGVTLVFVLILMTVTTGIVGWSTYLARQATTGLARDQRAHLEKVAASIESTYQSQLNVFESDPPGMTQDQFIDNFILNINNQAVAVNINGQNFPNVKSLLSLLNGAGQQKWDTQIDVSHRIPAVVPAGTVPGRVIVVWLRRFGSATPGPNTSVLNRANGVFAPVPDDTPFVLINTANFNTTALYKTKTQLNHLANAFQSYYRVRAKLSGMQYKDLNYFRPTNCATPLPANDLPCIDNYIAMDNALLGRIGVDTSAGVDAWGNAIQVSNLQGSNTNPAVGAFTMSLRATTPWGTTLLQTVDAPN